jgi:hypothetical protein
MRTLAITRTDGGISIMRVLQDDANLDQEVGKCGLDVVDYRVIEEADVPTDRTFRNAWTDTQEAIEVDMEKAKVFHMERIRAARTPQLQALDIEWMKAMGKMDQPAADKIEAQRQALRDLPQTLDLSKATTPDALKSLWPKELTTKP